jgi:DNA-binding HxlR family transcriptional regulator
MRRTTGQAADEPIIPQIPFQACPIRASLGVLGRKWTMLILRDIAALKIDSFSGIIRNNHDLTPRVLSMRLRELQLDGLITRHVNPKDTRDIKYRLTKKGYDVMPILTAFIQYGITHHAKRVFEDGRPRELSQVFPGKQAVLLGRLFAFADNSQATHA